jgi:hypothetical protein
MKKILIISFSIFLFSCKKEEKLNTQINATESKTVAESITNTTGANKLSFKVDGKLIECNKQVFCMATPGHGPKGSNPDDNAQVQGYFGSNNIGIGFIIDNNNNPKLDNDGSLIGNMMLSIDGKSYQYIPYISENEYVKITITNAEKTIGGGGIPVKLLSGNFEAKLKDNKGNQITITDGQFSATSVTGR